MAIEHVDVTQDIVSSVSSHTARWIRQKARWGHTARMFKGSAVFSCQRRFLVVTHSPKDQSACWRERTDRPVTRSWGRRAIF